MKGGNNVDYLAKH